VPALRGEQIKAGWLAATGLACCHPVGGLTHMKYDPFGTLVTGFSAEVG
jgi:hypothetical protein